jgi:hypothetical protein
MPRRLCRDAPGIPPTQLVGFVNGIHGILPSRLSMNDPPTALVGFGNRFMASGPCRLSMKRSTNCVGGIRSAHAQTKSGARLRPAVNLR